jgi:hypothetical protein
LAESRAIDEEYKADFRKVCQVTLENHLDLELILKSNMLLDQGAGEILADAE